MRILDESVFDESELKLILRKQDCGELEFQLNQSATFREGVWPTLLWLAGTAAERYASDGD